MDFETVVFSLIANSGEARSLCMEAIQHAKNGDFEEAHNSINEADQKMAAAHVHQTAMIQSEAQGNKTELTLLLVHAQDHLMNAIAIRDMANEFIDLYQLIKGR